MRTVDTRHTHARTHSHTHTRAHAHYDHCRHQHCTFVSMDSTHYTALGSMQREFRDDVLRMYERRWRSIALDH